MKPTALRSCSSYICLRSTFSLHFYSDLLNQKYKNTLLHFILFAIYYFNLLQFSPVYVPISGAVTRKGLTNPFTHWVASIRCLCVGAIYIVLLGSPTRLIYLSCNGKRCFVMGSILRCLIAMTERGTTRMYRFY